VDGCRPEQRTVHVRERRLVPAARVHRSRRHRQHRLAHRGADEDPRRIHPPLRIDACGTPPSAGRPPIGSGRSRCADGSRESSCGRSTVRSRRSAQTIARRSPEGRIAAVTVADAEGTRRAHATRKRGMAGAHRSRKPRARSRRRPPMLQGCVPGASASRLPLPTPSSRIRPGAGSDTRSTTQRELGRSQLLSVMLTEVRTRCEHQPVHARPRAGHSSPADSFGWRRFRARPDPTVPALPSFDGSSPSEGFPRFPEISSFAALPALRPSCERGANELRARLPDRVFSSDRVVAYRGILRRPPTIERMELP
jgi:hypothetical protein